MDYVLNGIRMEWLINYWKVMLLIGLCGCVIAINLKRENYEN